MEATLAALMAVVLAASVLSAWRLTSAPRRVVTPEGEAMRDALHHASATLPHLRRGLDEASAKRAAPHLRALTQAAGVAIVGSERVLAIDGTAVSRVQPSHLMALAGHVADGRTYVVPPPQSASCRQRSGHPTIVAPLIVQEQPVGALITLYGEERRLRPDDARVVAEVAALVAAQIELSLVARQEERTTQAELQALRARISPHFIYNSLAAIASYIHSRPADARTLLTEFAEFTRYAFRGERTYVTLSEELHYVEKYLLLEQARFGERLVVRVRVEPDVLQAVVPVLSLQPLVENAVRHGVEARSGARTVEIVGIDRDPDVELRVRDDGIGMDAVQARSALAGEGGGLGLCSVDRRLRAAFGESYGLSIATAREQGTTVTLVVPKFRVGVRAA